MTPEISKLSSSEAAARIAKKFATGDETILSDLAELKKVRKQEWLNGLATIAPLKAMNLLTPEDDNPGLWFACNGKEQHWSKYQRLIGRAIAMQKAYLPDLAAIIRCQMKGVMGTA